MYLEKKVRNGTIGFILIIGVLARIIWIGQVPGGIHQDEAYSGYEAYSLLKTGMDSHGYVNPVYFISWGHGMNALYAYLTIPFIAIGGLSVYTIRIPQIILGCLTLPLFYLFVKKIANERLAVISMFLLAVNPWHIMLCRWGLEANLVPFFLLLGAYFAVRALQENSKYYIPAFIAFGLSLYCYAIMWVFVPLFLFLLLVYTVYLKKIKVDRYMVTGIALLVLLALPLLLFLLINNGYIPEIRTSWISIPKMDSIRESEVSIRNLKENLKSLLYVLIWQKDDMLHNSPAVGIYYYCSIPFILAGGVISVVHLCKHIYQKIVGIQDVVCLWFLTACLVGCMISNVNVNRINCIHLPMIFFSAYGIELFLRKIKGNANKIAVVIITGIYVCSFIVFGLDYYSEKNTDFYYGYEDALTYAESITDGKIGTVMIRYPLILMHTKMLSKEYLQQMDGAKNFDTKGIFGRYVTEPSSEDMETDMVYVVSKSFEKQYLTEGFKTEFDNGSYVVIVGNNIIKKE